MDISRRRAEARRFSPVPALLLLLCGLASGEPLTLPEAIQLALDAQPALVAQSATARSLRNEAEAEAQLPDPQLVAGVMQMPVTGDSAFNLHEDDFTALSVGFSQEFPRAEKRELRSGRLRDQAVATEAALAGVDRRIRRDVALAYLDVLWASESSRIADAMAAEAEHQRDAARIDVASGRAGQPEALGAAVDAEVLADRGRAFRQRELAARATLARWIGAAADRPLPGGLPSLPEPMPLDSLIARLPEHPLLAEQAASARAAASGLRLAEAGVKPDWRVEVRYDHRLEFSDLFTVMVGVDMPLFAQRRQDQRTAAAREQLAASRAREDDILREATAALTTSYRNWQAGRQRLQRYDDVLLPESRARVAAALAAYQSGKGPLAAVLDARRGLLESELMHLDLEIGVMREQLALQYFGPEASQ